ncbi:hypothetical protein ACNKHN_16955 [Shigella flexneri]
MLQPLPQRMAEAIYQEKPDMPGYTQSMSWLKDLSHTGRRCRRNSLPQCAY